MVPTRNSPPTSAGKGAKPPWRHSLMVARARNVLRHFAEFLEPGMTMLSVGDGDGYVSRQMMRDHGLVVRGLEVGVDWPGRREEIPFDVYDGVTMPYEDESFDCVSAVFVLHHCDESDAVLREIVRVSRYKVVICEDVYQTSIGRLVVCAVDWLLNRLFGEGINIPFHYRKVGEWEEAFGKLGLAIEKSAPFRLVKGWPVRNHVFCLRKTGAAQKSRS